MNYMNFESVSEKYLDTYDILGLNTILQIYLNYNK